LERYVAVKVILPGQQHSEIFLKRFEREAKSLAKVSHPNIVPVHDFGEEEGVPYLVMEFLPGGTLKQKMGTPMPYTEAAKMLLPIARALEYAHREGIVHRDVKPANILITKAGDVMLSDFGIAKILDVEETSHLTGTGVGIGTPDYMAPEQGMGVQVDYRADIYSLGVVFYELVTGRKPYVADTPMAVLLKHISEPLPRPRTYMPNLPDAVEQVIFKAMAKKPEDRYQSMGEFAVALERIAQMKSTDLIEETETRTAVYSGRPQTPTEIATLPEKPRPNKVLPVAGVLVGVVLLGICVITGGTLLLSQSGLLGGEKKQTETSVVGNLSQSSTDSQTGMETQASGLPTMPTSALLFTVQPPSGPLGSQSGGESIPTVSPELLADFPKDVPLVEDPQNFMRMTAEGSITYTFMTSMTMPEAVKFYQTGMEKNGWKEIYKSETGQMISLTYNKEEAATQRVVMITFTPYEEAKAWVTIMLIEE
ncbi:MAG: serine/threonine-protein kinase, partial [Anaerolineales bacterium]